LDLTSPHLKYDRKERPEVRAVEGLLWPIATFHEVQLLLECGHRQANLAIGIRTPSHAPAGRSRPENTTSSPLSCCARRPV